MPSWKRTRTPRSIRWNSGPRTRIRIPQPVDRPVRYRRKDVLQWEEIRGKDPLSFILHRRGLKRPMIGQDTLEARAISKEYIRGTLPERIVYKFLVDKLRLADGVEFDFQSSMSGGRLELGGIVADFLFPIKMMVLQVQGPTHTGTLRMAKDEEQRGMLQDMGYSVVDIEEDTIYNESKFDEEMRKIFALNRSSGGGSYEVEAAEPAPVSEPVHLSPMPSNPTSFPAPAETLSVVGITPTVPTIRTVVSAIISQPAPTPTLPAKEVQYAPLVAAMDELERELARVVWQF